MAEAGIGDILLPAGSGPTDAWLPSNSLWQSRSAKLANFNFPLSLFLSWVLGANSTHARGRRNRSMQSTYISAFFFFLLLVLFKEVRVNNCCLTCLGANYFTTSPIIYTILNHLKGAFKKAFRKKNYLVRLIFFCRFGKLRQGSVFT